jgi:hypothetical protein
MDMVGVWVDEEEQIAGGFKGTWRSEMCQMLSICRRGLWDCGGER